MTKSPTPLELTLADLAISPLNVRFNQDDANAVEALSASIVAEGLLEQLLIHPADDGASWAERAPDAAEKYGQREPAAFGVFAGGRRYRAIRLAVERGHLPKNFPIRCDLRELTRAEIILLSLSENLLRRDLQGYEVHRAIAALRGEGMTIDQIAHDLGQSVDWVRQQARLGDLHPPIFEAYASGAIDVDQAKAFAATEDLELQAAAWQHFARKQSWDRDPAKIRAFYKVGDHQLTRLLKFVGEKAYTEAGGAFELDLFAAQQEHRGRVEDEELLQKLAEAKLKLTRAAIREQTGWRDLPFAARPPQRAGYTDTALEIHVDKPADLREAVPANTPDAAICVTLEIAATGKPIHRFWWVSHKARNEASKGQTARSEGQSVPSSTPSVAEGSGLTGWDQDARAVARDEHGLTATGLQVIRSQRRDLLRAVLLRDAGLGGNLARDYLVFGQLRQELGDDRPAHLGLRGVKSDYQNRDDEPREEVRPYCEDQLAGQYWKSAVEHILAQSWMAEPDPDQAFSLFVLQDEKQKAEAAAVLVGLTLLRSANTPGYRVKLHDRIAEIAGADAKQLRRFWQPDHRFAGLFPKLKRMELAQPFVEPDALKSWTRHHDRTLAAATAHVLGEQSDWIHPLVAFDFDGFAPARLDETAKELEAAE